MLAWVVFAQLAIPQLAYHSSTHDLVVYADGRALYRSERRLLEGHVDSLLAKEELATFEKNAQPKSGLQLCRTPAQSLTWGDRWIYFCIRQPIRPPPIARLLARLEKFVPARAKPWRPSRYHVFFALLRETWPTTLPRPKLGYSEVLVEANLLPEVKRYAKADPAARISWSPAIPGMTSRHDTETAQSAEQPRHSR